MFPYMLLVVGCFCLGLFLKCSCLFGLAFNIIFYKIANVIELRGETGRCFWVYFHRPCRLFHSQNLATPGNPEARCFECVGEERKKNNNTDTTTRYYKPSTSFALDQIGIGIEIWD